MINYYQPWLLPFLRFSKTPIAYNSKRFSYHSFEDALWDLLKNKKVSRNSLFLIPDFYCMDVLENITLHGYKYVLYPLNKNFQINPDKFHEYVKRYKPEVVVVFHACGITSNLIENLSWTRSLKAKSIIIEDSVHRIVNPSRLNFISDNHFVIDSLRKTTPLYGSNMYGTKAGMSFKPASFKGISGYFLKSIGYYTIFRATLQIGSLLNSTKLVENAHTLILKRHDNLIGDSLKSHPGFSFVSQLTDRINFEKVEKIKSRQVGYYERRFKKIFKNPHFYKVSIPIKDYGKLHVYPLGYTKKPDHNIEKFLLTKGVVVWFKFPESVWSKDKGILFLPLGFHINQKDIASIAKTLTFYDHLKLSKLWGNNIC